MEVLSPASLLSTLCFVAFIEPRLSLSLVRTKLSRRAISSLEVLVRLYPGPFERLDWYLFGPLESIWFWAFMPYFDCSLELKLEGRPLLTLWQLEPMISCLAEFILVHYGSFLALNSTFPALRLEIFAKLL
jgi:hypothetical protein